MRHHNMGAVFHEQGDHAGALEALGKALAIKEQVLGPQSEPVGKTCIGMATVHEAQGEREQARAFYGRAAAAYKAAGVDNAQSRQVAQALGMLA